MSEEVLHAPMYLERLVIRCGRRVFLRSVNEVEWFESHSNYVQLHLGKETHLIREAMNDFEGKLDPKRFVRIHRSAIVKIDAIREICIANSSEPLVTICDGTSLKLSRGYRRHFWSVVGEPR